jgi:signal peptide peptidase SppA
MSARSLPHLLACIYNTPLMVTEQKLEAVLAALPEILAARAELRISHGEDDDERKRPTYGYRIKDGVATVPVHGVLVRRAGQVTPKSEPLQSYERLSQILNSAVADQRVRGLLMDIDSPGGESGQALQLASEIRRLAQTKPIWSMANDDAMSAAYGLASGAHRIWITPTSGVGSIGTIAVHTDRTAADQSEGVKYTFVHAGDRKLDFTSHRPLNPVARERLQQEVNRLQSIFVDTVAAHRGLPPGRVAETQGGMLFGHEAISAGLADQVGTPAEAHAALAAYVTPSRVRSSAAMSQTTEQPGGEQPQPVQQQPAPQPQPVQQPAPQPQPAPPPPPPVAAHNDAPEVTNIVTMARQDERARAVEIVSACQLAHRPELAETLLRTEMTAEQARRHLLSLEAADSAARRVTPTSSATIEAAGPQPHPPINTAEAFATHRRQAAGRG